MKSVLAKSFFWISSLDRPMSFFPLNSKFRPIWNARNFLLNSFSMFELGAKTRVFGSV